MNYSELPFCSANGARTNVSLNSTEARVTQSAIVVTAMLGLIGNSLSMIVLRTPQMKSAYSFLLCALTVSDSVQLVVHLYFFGSYFIGLPQNRLDSMPDLTKGISMQAYIALTASSYFTVLLSFERYVAVCNPFKALALFPTKRRMLHYVLVIVIFSVLFNLPKWWERDAYVVDVRTNRLGLTSSKLKRNEMYQKLYVFWGNVMVNFVVPFSIISVLNGFIYKAIRDRNKAQRILATGQAQDMSITLMLVTVVVVFCFCNMFFTIIKTLRFFCPPLYSVTLTRIQNYLYTFNASINFVIYCFWGSKFRQQLRMVYQKQKKRCFCNQNELGHFQRQETRSSSLPATT